MSDSQFHEQKYLLPTPGGAFYAVADSMVNPPRRFLRHLLSYSQTPRMNPETLNQWAGETDLESSQEVLRRIQSMRWVQLLDQPMDVLQEPLEDILPGLLSNLSENGKALLADQQGFYLGSSGVPHESAEELAALSADLMNLQQRHRGLLLNNLNLGSQAWGVVDAGGHTRLGIWPLYIGKQCFALVMTGIPHFNHPSFVHLVWTLMTRYAPTPLTT